MTSDKEEKYILKKAQLGYDKETEEYKKLMVFFEESYDLNFNLEILLGHIKKINRELKLKLNNGGSFKPEETVLSVNDFYV